MGKTSWQVRERWKKDNYVRISVSVPKKDGEDFKEKCKRDGIAQAQVIKDAIAEFLRDK